MSSRHPATKLSRSGSPPSLRTRRLRNASSFCAFTSAADTSGSSRSTRRVRSMRSLAIARYSSGVTERPISLASSSRITRRSQTPLRQTANAMMSQNGTNIVSWTRLLVANAWKNPMSGICSLSGGGLPAAILVSVANSGSALFSMWAAMASASPNMGARMRNHLRRV
jgi:hypothetical protein